MRSLPRFEHPDLLVGTEHFADAGVYRVAPKLAVVQSTDFFSPIVDDAWAYGRIAAANALSDVYAAGARPITVLNIVMFPDDELELSVLETILAGAASAVLEAGAVVVGGHTIRAKEIVFGLAVTGVVDPDAMLTNTGAKPGDAVVLTKPLGTGVVATAHRREVCPPDTLAAAIASMGELNAAASAAAVEHGATAATDITGFGLAVHALELAEASGVRLTLDAGRLPILPGATELAKLEFRSRASISNRQRSTEAVRVDGDVGADLAELVFDPQTSGGLLLTASPAAAEAIAAAVPSAMVVGTVAAAGTTGPGLDVVAGVELLSG